MSRSGEITLDWGGELERVFRLGLGQAKKLQEGPADAGPLYIAAGCLISLAVLRAIEMQDYAALSQLDLSKCVEKAVVREVFVQGLLGANVPAPEAQKLVRDWVDERPLGESLIYAHAICMAHVVGVADERPVGEPQAAPAASPISPEASTASERMASTQ